MILALDYSYTSAVVDVSREGIGRYLKLLLNSIFMADPNFKLEAWSYDFNSVCIKNFLQDLYEKYPDKISFYDNTLVYKENIPFRYKAKNFIHILNYRIKYFLTKKQKYLDKINKYKNNTQPHIPIEKKREHLIKAIKKYSKANVVFSMHPQLELGKFFSCPKIMQLHDLFTFIPEIKVLFEKVCPINQINEQVQNNLEEYVKLNSVFITGTSYIAQTQIEKYTSAKKEQIKVIPYPQMLSEDYKEQIVEEKEFRNKYKIEGIYFPYPSLNRPNKNFMLILKALNILKQKKFSIKFVTTGSISTIPENEAYVNKHHLENMIIQTGSMPQKDLYALYKYASLVVVPTIIEGPGIPQQVLEPLKIGGIPVICSKCLGCEESLESVGLSFETADLNWVDCDDAQGLADKICSVLSNPKEHIEKQKHIIDFYTKITWKDTAEKYLEIFKELSNS